jgi:hypothetical protein
MNLTVQAAISATGRFFVYSADETSTGSPIYGPCEDMEDMLLEPDLSTNLTLDWHPCGHIITTLAHKGRVCVWRFAKGPIDGALSAPVYDSAEDIHNLNHRLANIIVVRISAVCIFLAAILC